MNRKLTGIACLVLIAASVMFIWFKTRLPSVKIDRTQTMGASRGVGQFLGEETVRAIGDRGGIVIVSEHNLNSTSDRNDERWNAFRDELKRHSGVTIIATETVTPQPEMGMPGCPGPAFVQILNQYRAAAAIVFLTDLPDWFAVSDSVPQDISAKIIALDTMGRLSQSHYRGYFDRGLLTLLIGGRSRPATGASSLPQTPREWFNKYFQVYTLQNLDEIPE